MKFVKLYSAAGFGDPKMFLRRYFNLTTGSEPLRPRKEVIDFYSNPINLIDTIFSKN